MPQIIPPSPDATSIGKFGDMPVGTYTGIPNISVPLYTINVRDISLPISLSYHASGIRVEEEASWVGLGWALNSGGMVSRTVRGNDDLAKADNQGFVYSPAIPEETLIEGSDPPATMLPFNYVQDLCLGGIDAQPDVFNFSFLGYSGKFFLKRKETTTDPIEVVLASDHEKILIKYDEVNEKWSIMTKEGIKAIFGTREYSNTVSGEVQDPKNPPSPLGWEIKEDIITSWYLDKLYSPSGEEITFEYDIPVGAAKPDYASRSIISISESHSVMAEYLDCNQIIELYGTPVGITCEGPQNPGTATGNPCANTTRKYSGSMTVTWNIYLKRILFKNGEIRFVTSERDDIEAHYTSDHVFSKPRKLDRIEVYQKSQFLKSFNFAQTYYNGNVSASPYLYKRLKLDQVVESSGSLSKKPYVFSYIGDNTTTSTFLPPKNDAARDHWGLYNGKTGNNTGALGNPVFIPELTYMGSDGIMRTIFGADRESDEESAKLGILEKITFPTGGYTKIFYESHLVSALQSEGVQGEREYFVSTSSLEGHTSVFELNSPVIAVINADIKCPTLSCYPSGTGDTPCAFTTEMYAEGENYVVLKNLETGEEVYSEGYSDYECKYYSSTPCASGVHTTYCGIHRLDEISLPAGRYMLQTIPKFGFEPQSSISYKLKLNAHLQSNLVHYKVGGLRVKRIIDHDGIDSSNDIVKRFDYTTKDAYGNILSTGQLMTVPKYHYYQHHTLISGENVSYCSVISSSSFSNVPLGTSAQGSAVGYEKVTVINGEYGENGFSVFEYKNDPDIETQPFLPNAPAITHNTSNGLLLREAHFTRDRFKVKEIVNGYSHVDSLFILQAVYTFSTNNCGFAEDGALAYKRYHEKSEWWQLTSQTERIFDVTDPGNVRNSETVTYHTYSNAHKMLSTSESTTSEGKILKTFYSYPLDLQAVSPSAMWDETDPNYKHMHGVLIKQETFEGDMSPKRISGTQNYYTTTSSFDVVKTSIETAGLDGLYAERIRFEKYDEQGNLLQVRKANDVPMSYLWGYDETLPVAEVMNAKWDQIYYESFEYNPSGIIDSELAHSGNGYISTSFTVPFAVPDGSQYELSYWKYSNDAWSQIREPYAASLTITGERLDDIRVYPVGAQMSTYNYDPLTGLSTATDMNNKSKHFRYDDLQRLIMVEDFEFQPLVAYKYKYKN